VGASAQGATACKFAALVKGTEPDGPPIKDAPQPDGHAVARLPALGDKLPEIQVIGVDNGWFLIDGASYPDSSSSSPAFTGRGWVEGRFVTTHLFRDTLKKSPSNEAPDASHLYGSSGGTAYQPYDLAVRRVLSCVGPWLEVEIDQPDARTLAGKPASAADGTVRGWTDRSCARQGQGPCPGEQFDYPWSPLPAGVTECSFRALSNDPDPAGLEVRDAPARNARVLGRMPPPREIGGYDVLTQIQVIGYRKGWFLIEAGPYSDTELAPGRPRPYSGRGWVAGSLLTTGLLRPTLKQAPSAQSADVIDLRDMMPGVIPTEPQDVKMRSLLSCSGDWVHVEIALAKGMKPLLESAAPQGALRGWADGTCAEQFAVCPPGGDTWSPAAPLPSE
jgi:hypothetical protein